MIETQGGCGSGGKKKKVEEDGEEDGDGVRRVRWAEPLTDFLWPERFF